MKCQSCSHWRASENGDIGECFHIAYGEAKLAYVWANSGDDWLGFTTNAEFFCAEFNNKEENAND